jgi:hypothetical protein
MTFVDPAALLAAMRRAPDTIITEPVFGDRVWLKQIPGGLTDCCLADDPCEYHAKLTNEAPKAKQ